ncbi:hypothetical protein HGRIS_002900 [Hohenbuehelia grisea]|uniref:NAD(P)-binding domain-containing protein n=1 Tax=Hohenbuehelia grisea TaxID=104357 RepID=A0ABR3JLU5_9AGAR
MAILLTGGTGKTGLRIARLLAKQGQTVYVASRSGNAAAPFVNVRFDWDDASTHDAPFTAAAAAGHHIDAVYLVGPQTFDMLTPMKPFIERATKEGVKRFVLLSASSTQKGDVPMGVVHAYLDETKLDYCVLRPTWFFENFSEGHHLHTIQKTDTIHTAAGDGVVPWISTEEIAEVAANALTAEKIEHRDLVIGGPELLTYDQIAALFTDVLGRPITHVKVASDKIKQTWLDDGLPEEVAETLTILDSLIASGVEERFAKAEPRHNGRRTIKEYIEANKAVWAKN